MSGQHFAVGVDVDTFIPCLLKQKLHVVQVMSAYYDKRTFFNSQRYNGRHRISVCLGICRVKHCHTLVVDPARFKYKLQKLIGIFFIGNRTQRLIEKVVYLSVGFAKSISMVSIGCHALNAEQDKGFKGAYILVCVPDFLHVVIVKLLRICTTFFLLNFCFQFFNCFVVEINVGNSSKQPFKHELISTLGEAAGFRRF